jgi:hypothetical protein
MNSAIICLQKRNFEQEYDFYFEVFSGRSFHFVKVKCAEPEMFHIWSDISFTCNV